MWRVQLWSRKPRAARRENIGVGGVVGAVAGQEESRADSIGRALCSSWDSHSSTSSCRTEAVNLGKVRLFHLQVTRAQMEVPHLADGFGVGSCDDSAAASLQLLKSREY